MTVDPSTLDRDLEVIRKRRPGAVHDGDEQPPVDRIPLASPGLMRITSGGIPLGRMTRLWGMPSAAKTLVGWMIIQGAQNLVTVSGDKVRTGLECTYYNVEKQYDPKFAEEQGIDIKRLKINEADIIEDITREMQLTLRSCHVHVIDSTSEAIPQDRLGKDAGDWDVGLSVRTWNKCMEYIHDAMDKDENAIISIDHAGKDFKTQSEFAKGGKELEFGSSLSLHMVRGSWLYYDPDGMLQTKDKLKEKGMLGIGSTPEADGIEFTVKVSKSRVCRPLRVAHLRWDLNKLEWDHTFELMEAAEYYDQWGFIAHRSGTIPIAHRASVKGGWYQLPSGEKVQGQGALRRKIDEDNELRELILDAMMKGN